VATYTADAVALLSYLVDVLPEKADQVFVEAEAGETAIQVPSTALSETLYAVSRDKDVRGVTLTGSPEEARQALVDNGPVSLAPVGDIDLREYATVVSDFTIHDGLVVASHRARATDGIITTDGRMAKAGIETVWK
jgi:predicted nucleic acid-binding protein